MRYEHLGQSWMTFKKNCAEIWELMFAVGIETAGPTEPGSHLSFVCPVGPDRARPAFLERRC